MARSANQKLKILYLLQYLMLNTDDEHHVSMQQMRDELLKHGISAERKSLYDDLDALRQFGIDVVNVPGRGSAYYIGQRRFELPELKLLVDSVQSSKFITEKKTLKLIKKIESLTSVHNAQLLQRQVYVRNRVKSMNESVYYNVDEISGAIADDSAIKFRYYDYDVYGRRRWRKNGGYYEISPFALMWDDENYYMLGYDPEANRMKHYRVDKMTAIASAGTARSGKELFAGTDMAEYSKRVFGMFTGEVQSVRLRFTNDLVGAVIDRFGRGTAIVPDGDDRFTVNVSVAVSPQFYAWLFAFGTSVEILSPDCVRDEFRRRIEELRKIY